MNYSIPEELRLMADTVRRFVNRELLPSWRRVEEEGAIPEDIVDGMRGLGLFGMAIPEEYGGLGLSTLGECLVYEELSHASACFRTRIATNNGIGAQGIVLDGTEEQKRRYLPKLASGEWTGCFALTEPEAGSDAANIRTTARREGEFWIIDGVKQFITNGEIADLATVFAVTDRARKARGITAFAVEKGTPGFKVGKIEKKMGLHGTHTCELVFDGCRVPADAVIGGEGKLGKGFATAMKVLDKGRLTMGASALGSAQRLLNICVEYAKTRVQFNQPIAKFQAIQWMLAEMATEIYAARQMLYHAAHLRDVKGTSVIAEASMVKLFCTEMANRVADKAVQIHGGMGYMKECEAERFYRDLRLTRIYEGTSEIQKVVIARELLKD